MILEARFLIVSTMFLQKVGALNQMWELYSSVSLIFKLLLDFLD